MNFDAAVDHDETGSTLIVRFHEEDMCHGLGHVKTDLGYAQVGDDEDALDLESVRWKLDPGDALRLRDTLNKQFGPTWDMMRSVEADVKAGRGPNGEPAGTWEKDERGDYERFILHPSPEALIDGADHARKARRES